MRMDSARAMRPVMPSRAKLEAPARSRSTAASSSVRVVVVGASALTATGVLERYQPSDAPPRVFQKRRSASSKMQDVGFKVRHAAVATRCHNAGGLEEGTP